METNNLNQAAGSQSGSNPEANRILKTDFLDLLFADRNKAYGAYELRRSYAKRMTPAQLSYHPTP